MKCTSLELLEITSHIPQAGGKMVRGRLLITGPLTYPCEKHLLGTTEQLSEPTMWWKPSTDLAKNVEVFRYVGSLFVKIDLTT